MKSNELRVGNLILLSNRVHKTNVGDIALVCSVTFSNKYKPIPLTEEWLLKFGFENWERDTINKYEAEHIFALFNIIDGSSTFKVCRIYSWYGIQNNSQEEIDKHLTLDWRIKIDHEIVYVYYELKYVHQLQNLYFSLTGEELELKTT